MSRTTTYNPILERNELRSLRLTAIPSPAIGTTLVLEPHQGRVIVISPGQPVPSPRTGRYKRSYVIDMNRYELKLDLSLPTRDPSFHFRGTVSFACCVRMPDLVATRGITDVAAVVRLPFMRLLRRVAQDFDISEANHAEAELNEVLAPYPGDDAITVGGYLVELSHGSQASASNADWHDASRRNRLDEVRRQAVRATARGGTEALIEDLLANHGGDPREVLDMISRGKALEVEQLLAAMEIMGRGERNSEPFDTVKERRKLLDHLMNGGSGGETQSSHTSRRSRLAGSLSKSLESANAVPDKSATGDAAGGRAESTDDGAPEKPATDGAGPSEGRRSRLRGVRVVESEPSDD